MTETSEFGRVADDGTVYVITDDGERTVGQWPAGDPAAALNFYRQRYEGLAVEVDLLEQRVKAGALSPEEAKATVTKMTAGLGDAQVVGDLKALAARLEALGPVIDEKRQERRAERAAKLTETTAAKDALVVEAEQLATGNDWRNGANRLRELLDSWKALPRIDKAGDDALWHRFSSARTTYTRRRKQHFAELNEKRTVAKAAKQKLVVEAEALSTSTEWGETARAYRDLMTRWKAAGAAQKDDDDALWAKFRAAQDAFFGARDTTNAKIDSEYAANAEVKRELLVKAEALLPVTDVKSTREAFRVIADQWDAAGKVPRADIKDLEARFKKVEQAVRGAEDDRWRRSNPEAHARAADAVAKLETSLASLEADLAKAEAAGNAKKAADARAGIEARESWLTEARKALTEFTP